MAFVCSVRSATVTAIANGEKIMEGMELEDGISSAKQSASAVHKNSYVEQVINSKNNGIGGRV